MDIKRVKEFLWCSKQEEIGEWEIKQYRQKIVYMCIGIILALVLAISICASCQWINVTKNADKYVEITYTDYFDDYKIEIDFVDYDDYEIDISFYDTNENHLETYQENGEYEYIILNNIPTYYEIHSLYKFNTAAESFLLFCNIMTIILIPSCGGWIYSGFFQSGYKEYKDERNKIVCISKGNKHKLYINNRLVDTEHSKMLGFDSKVLGAKVDDVEYVVKIGGTWKRELTLYKNNELIK